jgi:hypothetical protein
MMRWEKDFWEESTYDLYDDSNHHTDWAVVKLNRKLINTLIAGYKIGPKTPIRAGWYILPPGISYPDSFDTIAAIVVVGLRYETLKTAQVAATVLRSIHGDNR